MLVRAARRRLDGRPDPAAVQRPDAGPRVRRRLVRRRRRDRRLLRLRRRAAVPARPGRRREPVPITPGRSVALRRPAASISRAAGSSPSARTTRRRGRADVATRSSPSRSTATRAASSSCPGRTSSPRRASSPDGDRLAWLEWDHPDMPWDATRLRVAPIEPDGTLGESDAGRRRPGRVDRPARVGARRDAPPGQRPERLVEPVPARRGPAARAARADGGRVRRPGLDLRSVVVRVPRRRLDRRRSAGGPGRDRLFHIDAGRARRRGRDRRITELDALRVGAERPRRPGRRADRSGRRRALRPGDAGPVRRPAPGEHDDARPGDDLAARSRSSSRPTASGPRTRSTTRRRTRRSSAPDGELPPLVVADPRRPDLERARPRSTSTKQFLTSRGIAVVDVDYGGSTGYGRDVPAPARRAVGHRRRRRLRGGRALPRRARRRRPATGWRSRAAAPAATRRSRRSPSATCSRPGSASSASATSSCWRSDTHKFESRYVRPAGRPVPEGAATSTASARRSTSSTGSRCPVLVLQGARRPGRAAEPRPRRSWPRWPPTASRTPTSPFEGEGHGFRGADAIRRTLEAELSFLGQVFGFEPGRRDRAARGARASTPGATRAVSTAAGDRPG